MPAARGHAVDVVRRGLGPDEDHRAPGSATPPGPPPGLVTIGPLAMPGDAGRPVAIGRRKLLRTLATVGGWASSGRTRATASARESRERRVLGHVHGDPQRRLRAALADADLEHPEPTVLDRELDVAQVGVVVLQPRRVVAQVRGDGRQPLVEHGDRLGRVRAGDDVLALGVEQDVAVQRRLAGRGVAREEHARRRRRAAIAEDHRLDRHGGAEVVRDALLLPIRARAVALPGAEDGLDRDAELEPRIVRARRRRRRSIG